jgi:hypothetical protein
MKASKMEAREVTERRSQIGGQTSTDELSERG